MIHPPSVDPILADFCDKKIKEAAMINFRYKELWEEIKRYLMAGGKRMRPQLVMMAYEAYGGKNSKEILPIAAAWELIHACVLVHDDIIDRDTVRHGHPNIAGRYASIYSDAAKIDTSHYALSAALIAGDLLMMSAYEIIDSTPVNDKQKAIARSYITKAIFVVAGGELIDTDAVLFNISDTDPITVAKYKTASYSLQQPLQCGAALAGASAEEIQKLHSIGLHTGIAYQLCDDLLGIFGDSAVTGKSNRSDILEKKRTFLIQETLKLLPQDAAQTLTKLYGSDTTISEPDAEEVFQLIKASGAKETVKNRIEAETTKALQIISSLEVDNAWKDTFSGLVTTLTTRTH